MTPWDFGGVPRALTGFLKRHQPGRVLIPGCGAAYEVRPFIQAGWVVDAIDFSAEAVRRAKALLGDQGGNRVRQADFFVDTPCSSYDVIYERTFLTALSPQLWPAYAERITKALRPGGLLAGFFFHGPEPEPPPYALPPGGLAVILGSGFERIEDAQVDDSLPFFADKERWQVWRRL